MYGILPRAVGRRGDSRSMDDGSNRNRPAGGPPRTSRDRDAREGPRPARPSRPANGNGQGGGLLSRYSGDDGGQSPRREPSSPRNGSGRSGNGGGQEPSGGGLLSRARSGGDRELLRGAFTALGGQARRLGENVRRATGKGRDPKSGDWRASDFDQHTLDSWDRDERVPFDVPDEPEMGDPRTRPADDRRRPAPRDARPSGGGGRGYDDRARPRGWDDDEWDAGWETGTWDTGWATGFGPSLDYGRASGEDDDSGFWSPGRDEWDDGGRSDPLAESLNTLARLGAVHARMGRLARVRLLLRTRPAAAAMLAFFLLGFMLTCCAPMIPLLRLGYDASDALRRAQTLQGMLSDQSALLNATALKNAQEQVDGITHDLYEINSAMNIVGAPLSAVSPTVRNYRLLTRIGFDLTATASEGIQVAQTILTPLQGGALAADSSVPGLTMDDMNQAKAVLADAQVRLADALAANAQLDPSALKGPLSKFSKYLAILPEAPPILAEMQRLLDSAPALLGIGQNAYYLVVAMDRSELRPAGGFMGNYGILTLTGGRQSKQYPLSLEDTYNLDGDYYKSVYSQAPQGTPCVVGGPQPPNYYWWWPYRQDSGCQFDWGLRDSGLSPDFPTNARNAEQIVLDTPNKLPDNGKTLQGMIAFTPVLIEDLMAITGPIKVPDYNVTVTPQNLEHYIHYFQLVNNGGGSKPRKGFTHEISTIMLDDIKRLHGSALKQVFKVAVDALKSKDLQVYFNDPHAELIMQQLGLASQIASGNGDGFFVVDTNDGGNKANLYVNEHQTDYVTLLPDGGALHQLQISVSYNKTGPVFEGTQEQQDYVDMQRTYLPGDASVLGYSGFVPVNTFGAPGGCPMTWAAEISDTTCSPVYAFTTPVTASDVPGRTMVLGSLFVSCGRSMDPTHAVETAQDFADLGRYVGGGLVTVFDFNHGCWYNGPPIARTQNIYIEWYTPHAFTIGADGHGTYSELVEKQAGSADFATGVGDTLTVYVDTSLLHSKSGFSGNAAITSDAQWAALIAGKKPLPQYKDMKLLENTLVTFGF